MRQKTRDRPHSSYADDLLQTTASGRCNKDREHRQLGANAPSHASLPELGQEAAVRLGGITKPPCEDTDSIDSATSRRQSTVDSFSVGRMSHW